MTGEVETAGLAIHSKDGDVVGSLIAAIKELAARVEVETSRIVAARPFFSDECQKAVGTDRKDSHTVVQSVTGIHKATISGDKDFRTEVTAGKSRRQS